MVALSSGSKARLPPVPLLLSPSALSKLLSGPSPPKLLDASWHMPNLSPPRSGTQEYLSGPRLPGALRWDVDQVATRGPSVRGLPHMMPDPPTFARACTRRGICSQEDHVVCYDSTGLFSSPRLAFTFVAMGHERVSVLDGGLPAWRDEGHEVEEGEDRLTTLQRVYPTPSAVTPGFIRSYEEVRRTIADSATGRTQLPILDARPRGRYDGTAPEPRAGMKSGHMPGGLSLPFNEVVEAVKGEKGQFTKLKDQVALYRTLHGEPLLDFESLRHDSSSSSSGGGPTPAVMTTCGSGMTAAVLWLALRTLGVHAAVYDESWMGWAGREADGEDAPIIVTRKQDKQAM
ncbi:Rhodanese-like protein [Jaminaea rosea]|uniref:Rhodanese-like protein n=1 Tax=Jaminaea rosea TaxID=1569628 RepID=A0A316UTY8_9BASI|nr:Rhodanese-like protein [Jaminaea rosea]PWN27373.1 Rhodanese-like protein [Jaminaea rosea]